MGNINHKTYEAIAKVFWILIAIIVIFGIIEQMFF